MNDTEIGGQALPLGTRLEEFVIKRVLGTGGFGITYLAEDTSLGREVVIKENLPVQFAWREPATGTVRPRDTTGGDVEDFKWSLRNFLQEAETLASLDHPGIVKVLRKFEANGTAYFVMPFVEGVTLDALIETRKAKNQPFSEAEVRGFLLYMLASLGYLHERGIYHRDIKPGNVLVTMEGEPTLIDFGSARQRLSERSMTVIESAGYTPFEQLQSRGNVGPWSDLYALGATLVKAITFETPPKAADRMTGDPWKGLASNPEWMSLYSAGTLASIDRSMAVDPADRWQSAENWSTALSAQQSERASTGALPPPLTSPITRDGQADAREPQSAQTSHAATARGPAVTADAGVTGSGKRRQNSRAARKWVLVMASVLALAVLVGVVQWPDGPSQDEIAGHPPTSPLAREDLVPPITQDTNDPKNPRWTQLSQAYGFVLGQQATLELIEKRFPELATSVKEAWFAFNSTAFGQSLEGVENELALELGAQWPDYKGQMKTQFEGLLGNQDLTRQQAIEFLAEVRRRAKGKMPETIRSTLLSSVPRYSKNPALELFDGWKQTFRTKGHPKAKGVDFSISVPVSWSKREGNRPNIIQVFRSGSGHGPIVCSLMVRTIPLPTDYAPTKQELKEFFQPGELKGMVPDGGKFVTAQEIVLDGEPAGMLVCDITQQRLDITIAMRMTQFVTIRKNSMIIIQFAVSQLPGRKESLDQLQQRFLPTFKSVASTLVLNDRYK